MDFYIIASLVALLVFSGVFADVARAEDRINVLLGSVINGMWPITSESAVRSKIQVAKYAGVDAFESYIPWAVLEPLKEGEFDWREIEITEKIVREEDFLWQPFFMFNPSYATPQWFKNSPESVVFECIEHGQKSDVQSIWNPNLKKHIERVLTAFAERYGDSPTIHSVMLGVSGDFGETLYPAGAVGWNGHYHNHLGYWANDPYAQESLRSYLKEKYGDIKALNDSWNSRFRNFDEIRFLLLRTGKARNYSDRWWLDQIEWYRQEMLDWTEYWVKLAVELFPNKPVIICTGGIDEPPLGQDLSLINRLAAKYGVGIRLTNEASDYASNFAGTRLMVTGAKFFDVPFSLEPAGSVTLEGLGVRIFGAATVGADHIHYYNEQIIGNAESVETFMKDSHALIRRSPFVNVALFLPKTQLDLTEGRALHDFLYKRVRNLRDYVDFDLVDKHLIGDGILENYRVLVMIDGTIMEEDTLDIIDAWIRKGGILLKTDFGEIRTVEGKPPTFMDAIKKASFGTSKPHDNLEDLLKNYSLAWGDGRIIQHPARALSQFIVRESQLVGPILAELEYTYGDYPVNIDSVLDGKADGLFVSVLEDRVLFYNSSDNDVVKEFSINSVKHVVTIRGKSLETVMF